MHRHRLQLILLVEVGDGSVGQGVSNGDRSHCCSNPTAEFVAFVAGFAVVLLIGRRPKSKLLYSGIATYIEGGSRWTLGTSINWIS